MTELAKKVGQYTALVTITLIACLVMWHVSRRNSVVKPAGADVAPPAVAAQPKSPVEIAVVEPEVTELTVKYSGKIQPWETYSLGFEIGGRVDSLGENEAGEPLDDGDRVSAGQVLARLEDRIYVARRDEAAAQYEQAGSDLQRARRLREAGGQAITDAEYQEFLTAFALAKAQREIAVKNAEDTVLVSPVDGTIARRMVEPGESVGANTTVFEVVQNDELLLVLDVPEARVRELETRMRKVERAASAGASADPESRVFRAHVTLEGRNMFGERWPAIDGQVHRIAEVADARTGLFEVEVRVPNKDGMLRPGMVATAELVTDRLLAYRVPEIAVTFRGGEAYVFTVRGRPAPAEALFWTVGQTKLHLAHRIDLDRWVDQGDWIVTPAADYRLGPVVVRGQQRLAEGQRVRVVNREALGDVDMVAGSAGAQESVGVN